MAADAPAPQADTPDPEGFARLTEKIRTTTGFRCGSYKERCLRRRVAVRMRARAVHTFDDYAVVLDGDAREWERLLDVLTVNVTRFFRDASTFDAVAEQVLPALWRAAPGGLRAWSAGCASGEETYTLAMLLHRFAESIGDPHGLSHAHVLGTDIDGASLEAARAGRYAADALAELPTGLRERYLVGNGRASVADELRAMVAFERHDLLQDPPPAGPWHLIVCRNVLIYFDRATQERLLATFRDLLVPGGALVLGKVETLLGESRNGLAPLLPRERIFLRR